jgi:C-terminal processing protease CtpA/Prc
LTFLLPLTSAFAANSSKNFGGAGIDGIPRADGQIVVRQLVTGGPAHLAGVKVGDIITHVDGKPTRGSDFKQMVEYRLRGRAGTKVLITIRRPGEAKPRSFSMTRRQLQIKQQGPGS